LFQIGGTIQAVGNDSAAGIAKFDLNTHRFVTLPIGGTVNQFQ